MADVNGVLQGDTPSELNRVVNGCCIQCESKDVEEFVSCLFCKVSFHMNGCFENGDDDILPLTCSKNFYKAINNIGKFAHRPGNFRFVCDPCITNFETKETCTTNDHVQILDNRVTNLAGDVTVIKEMLKKLTTENTTPVTIQPTQASTDINNGWNNAARVQEIKSLLVVDKEVTLKTDELEQSITTNGIQVKGQYINKKGDHVFVLPSAKARDELKNKLTSSGISQEKISEPKQRYPAISVVGISNNYNIENKEDLVNCLIRQNPYIGELAKVSDSMFDVLVIKPVKSNLNVKQAIIRLSDNIRYAIKNAGDRLFCGMSSCKVYDQLYIKRCNRCQEFGHYVKDCKGLVSCGICASPDHESKDCTHKDKPNLNEFVCCSNCKKAGLTDQMVSHSATSLSCPTYLEKQKKLKGSLPFYSRSKN